MRFHRFEAYRPYEVTPRKLSALARRQRAEREALPLFAEQIAAEQPSAARNGRARSGATGIARPSSGGEGGASFGHCPKRSAHGSCSTGSRNGAAL